MEKNMIIENESFTSTENKNYFNENIKVIEKMTDLILLIMILKFSILREKSLVLVNGLKLNNSRKLFLLQKNMNLLLI